MASGIKLSYEHVYEYLKNLGFELIDEARPHTRDFSHELGRLYIC